MDVHECVVDQRWSELVQVFTADGSKHLLLAEYQSWRSSWEPRPRSSRFEVQVSYFWGPLAYRITRSVTHMGGRCESGRGLSVSLGDITVDPEELRGLQIGTYFFDQIVKWAHTHDSALNVHQLWLAPIDFRPENAARRFQFYKRFGIEFLDMPDDGRPPANTKSLPELTVGQLLRVRARNIRAQAWHTGMRDVWTDALRAHSDVVDLRAMLLDNHKVSRHAIDRLTQFWRVVFQFVNWPAYAGFLYLGVLLANGSEPLLQLLRGG